MIGFPLSPFVRRSLLTLAVGGWCAIILLSILPGSVRPHTGAGGISEHFLAYAAVAFLGGLMLNSTTQKLWIGSVLTLTAAILEIVQTYIPGRNSEWQGFLSGALGTWSAITVLLLVVFISTRRRT